MEKRHKIDKILREICPNVIFGTKTNTTLVYPYIRYSLSNINNNYANNNKYINKERYRVILVEQSFDTKLFKKISDLPYTIFETQYNTDGLYQSIFTLTI